MSIWRVIVAGAGALVFAVCGVRAELVVTEVLSGSRQYGPVAMDWWELTNTGPDSVNLLGYSWDDNHERPGQNMFGNVSISPGESIIILNDQGANVPAWRQNWRLAEQVHVIAIETMQGVSGFSSLGSSDGVFIYYPDDEPVTSATYTDGGWRSKAWHTDGLYLGSSRPGWLGAYRSYNEHHDIASPGYAFAGEVNALYGMIYWSDKDSVKIQRRNWYTGEVEDLLTAADGLGEPRGIALDVPAGRLYWADTALGTISTADLDGANIRTILTGLAAPADMDINLRDGFLYWAEIGAGKIRRMDLSTEEVEDVLTGLPQPYYIELDLANNWLFWSYVEDTVIERSDLDGGDRQVVVTGQQWVRDMVAASVGTRLYWADREASTIRYMERGIPMPFDHYSSAEGLIRPHGMAVDEETMALYWTDTRSRDIKIGSVNAGEDVSVLVSGLVGPWAIEVISLSANYDKDLDTDLSDFAVLARHWLEENPGADITGDGFVDMEDLASAFATFWLRGPLE